MSWVRLDDGFIDHPKVGALSDRLFRIHVAALCYCARYRTQGVVPISAWKTIGVTKAALDRFLELRLWETDDQGVVHVHDFPKYNPRDVVGAERQRRYRQRKRYGESDPDVTQGVTDDVTSSRVGARARPVPSPKRGGDGTRGVGAAGVAGTAAAPRTTGTNVTPADPYAAIVQQIRNGAISDQIDLDAELAGYQLPDEQAAELRAMLR